MSDDTDGTCNIKVVKWVLDTRNLWCIPGNFKAREEVQVLRKVASRALNLLSGKEQESVLRYYHVRDAKMSLASFLLKHLVITKYMSIPWTKSLISIDRYGKPYFISDESQPLHLDFNVSHQAGVVILIAAITNRTEVKVGADIVCVDERRQENYTQIDVSGFFNWLSIFEEVFADIELSSIRGGSLSLEDVGIYLQGAQLTSMGKDILDRCERRNQTISLPILTNGVPSEIQLESNIVIDVKLRQFYASWCLRESYIKMTGEALSAPWLRDLEILQVKAPKPTKKTLVLRTGEKINNFAINLKSKESTRSCITNVTMDLTSLGLDYLLAGAIYTAEYECVPKIDTGEWKILDALKDVIEVAEASLNEANG
ncbi:hypothetical protein EPUL_004514, partial [Erysiphe pulchra]